MYKLTTYMYMLLPNIMRILHIICSLLSCSARTTQTYFSNWTCLEIPRIT